MDKRLIKRSVQTLPAANDSLFSKGLFLTLTNAADRIVPWGRDWTLRDQQLAHFWPTEPFLSSAIFSIVATRAAFNWQLDGPPRTVKKVHEMLHNSDFGKGWISLSQKVCLDLITQDNGSIVEIIRRGNTQNSPVLGLAHIPANACIRTGDPLEPIIYIDKNGVTRKLKWWQVITFEELPATDPEANGRQYCFVSRVLKAAEIVRDINIYQQEKVSGRFSRAIHLVGGVAQHEIEDIQVAANLDADNASLIRYMQPIILAALDPNAKVSHELIELASLPDAFSLDQLLQWYIVVIAMGAGGDFQDFAPLSSGNLGTASQSETLHKKSRIRGHQLWIKLWEHKLQHAKVIPPSVTFRFMQQDAAAEMEQVEISQVRTQTRKLQLEAGEIDLNVARQIAVDQGDLSQEYLVMMGDTDKTPFVTVPDDEIPTIDESTVSLQTADKAAQWWRRILSEHPVQVSAPISEEKLDIFQQSLRNMIDHSMVIKTTEGWQDYVLTQAAYEAGIHPHALRWRLPDSYRVFVTRNKVSDSRGNVIFYQPEKTKTKQIPSIMIAKGVVCYKCGKEAAGFVYLPFNGWQATCKTHNNNGLRGKALNTQYDLPELITAFKEQAVAILETLDYNSRKSRLNGLFLSTLDYAHKLGGGKENKSYLQEKVAEQRIIENVEILALSVIETYYKALLERF